MGDKRRSKEWDRSFDAHTEADEIKRLSHLRKRHRYCRSTLDSFRGELAALYNEGLSFAQLALWLQSKKKIRISRSSVHRKMSQWPEVQIRGRSSNA